MGHLGEEMRRTAHENHVNNMVLVGGLLLSRSFSEPIPNYPTPTHYTP